MVVIILRRRCCYDNTLQPLNHPTANEPRNDHPHRKTMIRQQLFPVLHVRQYDVSSWIHCHLYA
ncbi:hypothetical protein HanIR_Chr09g0419921 [Helianthus annuus]|nr:hypothetical protein HanIR_Chr09g0419921 [Helianthus annuus]